MFDVIKDFFVNLFKSRIFILAIILVVLFGVLGYRIFQLQIVDGASYADKYSLRLEKERTIQGTRGCIYDRNGKLLAYNELSYNIIMEDSGVYDTTEEKNLVLNEEISKLIDIIEKNGDSIVNTFHIDFNDGNYEFNVEGNSLKLFRADVFGRSASSTSDNPLQYNKKLGLDEETASADQIMEYLMGEHRFDIDTEKYDPLKAYKITVIRFSLAENSYQRYISTTVAEDVSETTVALVSEYCDILTGVSVAEDTKRIYNESEYMAPIVGYTGKISDEEYETLSKEDDSYSRNDVVGKIGIEKSMESYLQGKKGYEKVFVDSLGRVLETTEHVDSTTGNDVYLSIDTELQKAVYQLIEQELAGIVYAGIRNVKEYEETGSASDIIIPIYDVYYALFNNSVLDLEQIEQAESGTEQANVYSTFISNRDTAIERIITELEAVEPAIYNECSEELQEYMTYIVTMLQSKTIFDANLVDSSNETYKQWKDGEISVQEYLKYAISQNWIEAGNFETNEKYTDSGETFDALIAYLREELPTDRGFIKKVYQEMIQADSITGRQICIMLYEQGILEDQDNELEKLRSGETSAYELLKSKIRNLEITPAQLALDPCTGSSVVLDAQTGEVLACVTYPGYDNNRLANTMDADYYSSLQEDLTSPFYNNATQQTTAPGSTFKMVTATAGLTEHAITVSEEIEDKGTRFDRVTNGPRCWIYPGNHGLINISEAIRDSCNYFFYEVGYRLSTNANGEYSEALGVETLQKYAELYGFGDKTGVEIEESNPKMADEYPITMAIGQSNNSYSTIQLARYVTAVANSGTVYNLSLLDRVTDSDGNVVEEFGPSVKNTLDEVADQTWDAIHKGMRMVVTQEHDEFDDLDVSVAGKTGTAQQISTRPNHALFVGYAPYEVPEVTIATRIAYGYSSANAADLSSNILEYYFHPENAEELLHGTAESVNSTSGGFTD